MYQNKLKLSKLFLILLLSIFAITLYACDKDENDGEEPEIENQVSHDVYNIMERTEHETAVHIFKSNLPGPKVVIVGGIHGDETAGWKTALNLVERVNFFRGEVIIIPQAYIKADNMVNRYPGYTATNGAKYSKALDLNRNFPGKVDGTETEKIAFVITQEVEKHEADYIIDLHESRKSYSDTDPLLGDLLIYGNVDSSLFCYDLVNEFNKSYLKEGEVNFSFDTNAPDGAFNQYFGDTYPNAIVFTVETNRQLEEARRIEQQTQILDLLFETIWN